MKNLSPDLGGKVYSRKYEDEVHTVKLTGLSSSKMGKPQEESEDVEEEIVLKEESLLKCPDWDGDTWEDSSLVVKKFGNSFNRNEITANDLTSDGSMSDDCRSLRTKCSDASIFIPQSSSMKTERVPLSTELNDSCCPSSQVCNSHDCDPSVSNECVKGLGPGRKVSQETVGNVHCKCCLCHSNVTNPSNICNGEVHPNFNTSQNSISNDCTVQTAKPHIGSQTDLSSETTSNNKNCSPVHIETLLENIPLAYSPRTKQLHIISVKPESKGNTHSCEAKTVEAEQVENCGRALESITEAQENDPEADVIINIVDKQDSISYDSPRNTLQRVGTCTSLTRTDDSSFSSISSLSTNTDFSTSAPSAGDDASDCRSNAFDCEDSVFSEGIHHSRKPYDTSHGAVNQGAKPKRGGITGFLTRNFFSWRSKDPSPHTPGWKLFTKGSQHHIPVNCEADQINEESDVSEDSGSVHLGSPDFNKVKHKLSHLSDSNTSLNRKRSSDFVPSSTTALILENRPAHLPAKSLEEEQRHRHQYEQMVEAARKKELKEAKVQKKLLQQQLKQENLITQAVRIWNNDVLPNWETMKTSRKARDLWWQGLPPSVRGKVWKLAVGNELHITSELYEICVNRARDRIRMASESASISEDDPEESSPDKEGSVDLIKLDVSRTFPQLCIFQKGGPYYDLLHSLLGAYVCYRPDVGYVQGMSFLAAVLILNLDVADSFICFANLLNKPCQLAFFRLDESMMKSYFKTYEEFFKENLPKLFRYFEKLTLSPDLYLIDWIYTLYSKSLPLDVACRVWDVFFRDGEEFLFRTALGILNLYQEVLVNMEFIHLAQFLTRLPEDILSESLFHSIETIRMAIDKKRFAQVLALNIETSDT